MREMTDTEKLAAAEDVILRINFLVDKWLDRNKIYTRLQYGKAEVLKMKETLDEYLGSPGKPVDNG